MAQLPTLSSAPMVASARTPQTSPRRTRAGAPVPQASKDETMSVGAYLLQGSAFIGFLLVLFMLAGFRG